MSQIPQPYVLTRDTTCREGCPHYGHLAVPHSHYEQKEPAAPDWKPNWAWRLAFRIYGDGDPTANAGTERRG